MFHFPFVRRSPSKQRTARRPHRPLTFESLESRWALAGDLSGDGPVDRVDLAMLTGNYGIESGASPEEGDLNGDGAVGLADLARLTFGSPPTGNLNVALTANVTNVKTAGSAITYTYTIQSTSSTTLTNVMLTDSFGLVPARQADSSGDNDNLLEAGETWRFTATYPATQAVLNTGLDLVNVATADSDQSPPDTDDAIVFNLYAVPGPTTVGDIVIHPINHASFVMVWNNVVIYVDPVGDASLYASLPKADLVLVTHSHPDHYNADTISKILDIDSTDGDGLGRILLPQAVYNLSSFAGLRTSATSLNNNMNADLLGLNVAAVPAYNTNHPRGTGNAGNGYVVTLGGRRIYISGDTGDVSEIRALENIDVAFVCMNEPFTMNVTLAASVVRDIDPTIIIPYHYRNGGNPTTYADFELFKTLVGLDLGIEIRLRKWY